MHIQQIICSIFYTILHYIHWNYVFLYETYDILVSLHNFTRYVHKFSGRLGERIRGSSPKQKTWWDRGARWYGRILPEMVDDGASCFLPLKEGGWFCIWGGSQRDECDEVFQRIIWGFLGMVKHQPHQDEESQCWEHVSNRSGLRRVS